MFYPIDLLSRRRGHLAPCWLAATLSKKLFKRHYNSNAMKKMNVTKICDEILKIIQQRSSQRISLYLSSQLLWGVLKIHQYQTTCFEKDMFAMLRELNDVMPARSLRENFDAVDIPMIEMPLEDENVLPDQLSEDLHLLSEEPDEWWRMRKQEECLNFGMLTNEDLELLLNPNGEIAFGMDVDVVADNNRERDVSKIAEVEVHREMQSPRVVMKSPALLDASKSKARSDRRSSSLTPQKRLTTHPRVETPSKRRRLSLEDLPPVPLEDAIAPQTSAIPAPLEDVAPEVHMEETSAPAPPLPKEQMPPLQQAESDMELESVQTRSFGSKKRPKRGKFVDKKIKLEDKLLRQWTQNPRSHCRFWRFPEDVILPHRRPSAIELCNRPSHQSKRWASKLYNLFADNITGPFTVPNQEDTAMSMQEMREATSRLDPTDEWSTLGKLQSTTAADGTAIESVSNILPPIDIEMEDIHHDVAPLNNTREASTVPLAEAELTISEPLQNVNIAEHVHDQIEVDEVNETLVDVEVMLEKRWHPSVMRDRVSKSSTPISESVHLPVQDIMAMLEVLWCDREIVKFDDLISRETYSVQDVVNVFDILLVLHAKKKLVLRQRACYRTLWIAKI